MVNVGPEQSPLQSSQFPLGSGRARRNSGGARPDGISLGNADTVQGMTDPGALEPSPAPASGPSLGAGAKSMPQWIYHALVQRLHLSQVRVRTRVRGNHLHILLEGPTTPDQAQVMPILAPQVTQPLLLSLLPPETPAIYQIVIYGRTINATQADWTEVLPVLEIAAEPQIARSPQPITQAAVTQESESHPASHSAPTEAVSAPLAPVKSYEGDRDLLIPEHPIPEHPIPEHPIVEHPIPEQAIAEHPIVEQAIAELPIAQVPDAHLPVVEGPEVETAPASPATAPRGPVAFAQAIATGQAALNERGAPGAESESAPLEAAPKAPPPLVTALNASSSQNQSAPQVTPSPEAPPSLQDLAKQGDPRAIARWLSESLSQFGVAVRAKVEAIPNSTSRRLLVLCQAPYLLDARQLAEPLAKRLRALELGSFLDAVVYGQVAGEPKPEWALRIDLTPPELLLQYWARWGDVQAIVQLLNRRFQSSAFRLNALQQESHLHIICQGSGVEHLDGLTVAREMGPILAGLKPQGLPAATLYGVSQGISQDRANAAIPTDPLWQELIHLPAADLPTLLTSPLALAQQGDLEAISFLLDRGLNPDLQQKLATGGLRVQVRQQNDLLYIMVDGPTCPYQSTVAPTVLRFLKPLHLDQVDGLTLSGVRVYGRMAGEKMPRWNVAYDFGDRKRLVPEATPEFAASAAYLGELLTEPAGPLVSTHSREVDWDTADWWDARREMLQRMLIATHLFRPIEADVLGAPEPGSPELESQAIAEHGSQSASGSTERGQIAAALDSVHRNRPVALVWSLVGMLLLGWSDQWIGSQLKLWAEAEAAIPKTTSLASKPAPGRLDAGAKAAKSASTAQSPGQKANLPKLSLQKTKGFEGYRGSSGFTRQQGTTLAEAVAERDANLPASLLQPKASTVIKPLDYPSFSSQQLDEKIALYQQYVNLNGAPDVLIIGSSRAMRGVDPAALKQFLAQQGYRDLKVFNLGINGATAQVVDFTLRRLLPTSALPKLVLWADGARAFNSGRSDVTYRSLMRSPGYQALNGGRSPFSEAIAAQPAHTSSVSKLPDAKRPDQTPAGASPSQDLSHQLDQAVAAVSPGIAQRDRLKGWAHQQIAAWLPKGDTMALVGEAITDSLGNTSSPSAEAAGLPNSDGAGLVDLDGFLPMPHRFNPTTYYQKYTRVSGDFDSDYENFSLQGKQFAALQSVASFTQARQIKLVFVNLPLTENYLDPVRRRHEATFTQGLQQAASQLGFSFRDLGTPLAADYFSDPSHLNRYGGYEVARRLATDVLMPWSQVKSRVQPPGSLSPAGQPSDPNPSAIAP